MSGWHLKSQHERLIATHFTSIWHLLIRQDKINKDIQNEVYMGRKSSHLIETKTFIKKHNKVDLDLEGVFLFGKLGRNNL